MEYDIIVVGGGHAGCEACLASARKGKKTLLITSNKNNIADMPCNPSIGGPAKGIVVREISALGGEMARNIDKSFLQMKMLKPSFAVLDEIDSGLDVDALKIVGENVDAMRSPDFGAIIITHYERLLDYIHCDYVHILMGGKIVKTGGKELIEKVDAEGYDWLKEELGIVDEVPQKAKTVLGTCAVKKSSEVK